MIVHMKRSSLSQPTPQTGALYTEKITLINGESDIFILPIAEIYSIAVNIAGSGIFSVSNDSVQDLENDNADFINWDGSSIINIGITAFKITWTSGTVVAKIAVKTANV